STPDGPAETRFGTMNKRTTATRPRLTAPQRRRIVLRIQFSYQGGDRPQISRISARQCRYALLSCQAMPVPGRAMDGWVGRLRFFGRDETCVNRTPGRTP